MSRVVNPVPQYFDSSGDPLVSGKAFFYESGTNTLKTTYADSSETIPNSNPVILAADGRLPNVFFSGAARMVLTDSDSVQIFDRDPLGSDSLGGNFSDWDNTTIYSSGDIVIGSDGKYYVSLISGNQSNDPTTTPTAWLEVKFINVWNTNKTFNLNDVAQASDGLLYRSLIASNTANDPTISPTEWGFPSSEVQTVNIADGAIIEVKLATNSVSTDKIQNDAVTTDKILDDNIITSKILDGSITTDKILDDAVTLGKMDKGTVGALVTYDLSQDPTELIPSTVDFLLTDNGVGSPPSYKALDISKDSTPKLGGPLDQNGNYIGSGKGSDIASAISIVIPTDGDYFDITGTATIETITVAVNRQVKIKIISGLTLKSSASIITPTGADFNVPAGYTVLLQSTGANIVQVFSGVQTVSGSSVDNTDPSNPIVGTAITLGTPVDTTSGTSIDFTSIPTGTKRITINLVGVSKSDASFPIIQIGDSGGIESTGYLGSGSVFDSGSSFVANFTDGFGLRMGAAANIFHGSIVLNLVDSSTFTWACSGVLGQSDAALSGLTAGSKSLTAELDRIRLTTQAGTGTFDAGKMNISYE